MEARDSLVDGYLRWCKLPDHPAPDDSVEERAYLELADLSGRDPAAAWNVVLAVIRRMTAGEFGLGLVAADAMEELLDLDPDVSLAVLRGASSDERVREALTYVRVLDDALYSEVQSIATGNAPGN